MNAASASNSKVYVGVVPGRDTYNERIVEVVRSMSVEQLQFPDARSGLGWEDDLTTPRRAGELVLALESTWKIIERCLDRWMPEMLDDRLGAAGASGTRVHTRQSVLIRLISHDA